MHIYVWMPCWTWRPYPEVIFNIFNQTCFKDHTILFDMESIVSGMPVQDARNMIVKNFLKSHYDYLWFVDDDNPPKLDVLEKLLSHEKDFVSALVPIRHWDRYLLNVFKDWKHVTSYEWMDDLIEVYNAWTWCVLMSYDLVESVYNHTKWRPYQFRLDSHILNTKTNKTELYEYQDRYMKDWKDIYKMDEKGEIMVKQENISEDLFFGRTAKDLWYKLYADTRCHCTHYKVSTTKLKVKNENIINHNSDS